MIVFLVIVIIFSEYSISLASQQYEVITTEARSDGFGAHVLHNIATFVYAQINNKEFCYRPFSKMQHNYDNDPDFIAKKEWLLNFKDNFLNIGEAEKHGYLITPIYSDYYLKHFNAHIKNSLLTLEKLKKIFRSNKKIDHFGNSRFNIAVHIRRPNPHDDRTWGPDVPDEIYLNVINKLRSLYTLTDPLFHIYSQGDISNFNIYQYHDVVLHINESIEDTYLGMVFADVLVTGKSGFSYTAGLLSDGTVYYLDYDPFMKNHLPHWIPIERILLEKISYNLVSGLPTIDITRESEKIGSSWQNGTVHDKGLIYKFYSLLPKDTFFVAIDIGAQTGSFSLLAKYFPHSQWYSFEPIKEAVDNLKNNLMLNNINNVSVYQQAVADFSGRGILKIPTTTKTNWELATMGTPSRFNDFIQREVQCIKLDNFIQYHDIKKVNFMKIGAEGSELFILRGAQRMIKRDHPIILMEYDEANMKQCSAPKQYVHTILKELGYAWSFVSQKDILCVPH